MNLNAKGKVCLFALLVLAAANVARFPQTAALNAWIAFAFGIAGLVVTRGAR